MNTVADEERSNIEKVLQGDYLAFEQIVDKYEGRIYRHLRKMLNDNHVAEDLLQETFLNAYRGLKNFQGDSSFSTWLFKIATNSALMYLRKAKPESVEYRDEMSDSSDSGLWGASAEFVNSPLDNLLSEEGRRKIEEAIEALPLLYRSVLVLRDVEGFSLQEVAEILETSVTAVKSRLHRARNAVRESLVMYYFDREPASGGVA